MKNSSEWVATRFCIGPILFLTCMDDFEVTVANKIFTFLDEGKHFRKIKDHGNEQQMQDDNGLKNGRCYY